jgi:ketosteroid isomerase-like protein
MMLAEALHSGLESTLHMSRFFICIFVAVFASDVAVAQNSASAPAVAPGVTSAASTDVTQFQKIEDSWSNAVNRHDQYSLELVLSPLFIDVSAQGDVTTRNQQVVQVINGEDKTVSIEQKVITVRMLGDIAVANGTYTLHHKVGSAPVDEKGVFTHVFEKVRGGWMCINSQRTVLRQDVNTKQKKSSNSSDPFHIPLFSKGNK